MKNIRFVVPLTFMLSFFQCSSQNNPSAPMNKHQNRLAQASSPYLQQHAHNPVDWYEWGNEALRRAQKENKPILISIGYAACHWCHVMAHESFEDSLVAAYMNEHFINIKIDREERPDLDQVYMEAAQLISGRGGWPLNAFALADGRPFYAASYFPKDTWMNLLQQIHKLYTEDYHKLEEQAIALTDGINKHEFKAIEDLRSQEMDKEDYFKIFSHWEATIDFKLGGFNRAPKFPLPIAWEFLLQYHYLTGSKIALKAVETTLDEMDKGGIYDQIGGGFSRYSVDEYWKVPHFEKMLYDNGQLLSLYAHAYQLTKNDDYERIIRQTIDFVRRELMSPEGGFYSSLDADSEGEEGKFYVWTGSEIEEVLSKEEFSLIKEYYQVTKEGNWEQGVNILHAKFSPGEFAEKKKHDASEFEKVLKDSNKKLLSRRAERIRPETDDKILTSWNALMMKGLIDAYRALGNPGDLQLALTNASFLETNMMEPDGELWRNYKDGKVSVKAFLDDYALLAEAFIELYQVTFNKHWLDLSHKLSEHVLLHFSDQKTGLFFYTSDQSESLIARIHEVPDNVIPSSNSVLANVLYRLGLYFDKPEYTKRAEQMLRQVLDEKTITSPYYSNWMLLHGLISHDFSEIAITGEASLLQAIELQNNYLPTSIFLGGTEENLVLLENKLIPNETLIYICINKTCELPLKESREALSVLLPKK